MSVMRILVLLVVMLVDPRDRYPACMEHSAGRGQKYIPSPYPLHTLDLVGAEQLQSKGPAKRHSHLVTFSFGLHPGMLYKLISDDNRKSIPTSKECTSHMHIQYTPLVL